MNFYHQSIINTHRHHSHHSSSVENSRDMRRLLVAMGINLLIPLVQIVGGLYAQSMAIVADATHNFSDFAALFISYIAIIIASWGASTTHTFGFKRAEVIATCINTILLLFACGIILKEAVERFFHSSTVMGSLVILLALLGIVGNGFSAWLLYGCSRENINIKGAFLHMVADMLTSVAVLIVGAVLMFKPWYWLDPVLSIIIIAFILRNCWFILKEAIRILMDAVPDNINLGEVKRVVEAIPGVLGAHYIHVWSINPTTTALSCHVVVHDTRLSKLDELRRHIENELARKFGINHPVLQFESRECGNGGLLCEVSCTAPKRKSNNSKWPKLLNLRPHNWLITVSRIVLGLIFLYASYDKILHPQAFAEVIYNYDILPSNLINIVAIVIPWIECFIGLSMLVGISILGSLFLTILCLVIFTGALIINIIRGIDVSCGCFSTDVTEASSLEMWLDVIRDLILLIWAGWLFIYYAHNSNSVCNNRILKNFWKKVNL